MIASLADESALLFELRALADHGDYRAIAERLATLDPGDIATRTSLALLAAEAHGRLGELAAAERWATRAQERAATAGDGYSEQRALNVRGIVALEQGDAAAAETWFSAALERSRVAPDAALDARAFNNLGVLADLRRDPATALTSYQLALASYQQAGQVRGMAETYHNIAISRLHLSDVRGALAAADEAVRLAGQLADERLTAQALAGRAEMHLAHGDAALAAAELQRAGAAYERLRNPVGLAEVWRLQAAVARHSSLLTLAVSLLERATGLAREAKSAHTLAEIERDLAATLHLMGDQRGADAARGRARDLFRQLGAPDSS